MSTHIVSVSCPLKRMPVVRRCAVGSMLSLKNSVRDELAGMLIGQTVEHPCALAAGRHEVPEPQFREVLGDGSLRLIDRLGELVYRELSVSQSQNDANSRGVGEHRKDLDGQLDVLSIRIKRAHLLICIHTQIIAHAFSDAIEARNRVRSAIPLAGETQMTSYGVSRRARRGACQRS